MYFLFLFFFACSEDSEDSEFFMLTEIKKNIPANNPNAPTIIVNTIFSPL